jgi:hypothetical protein
MIEGFKQWCGLTSMHGVINSTHIVIYRPKTFFSWILLLYHKTNGYLIVVHDIVNYNKKILDICLNLLGSVNDFTYYVGLHCINVLNIKVGLMLGKV